MKLEAFHYYPNYGKFPDNISAAVAVEGYGKLELKDCVSEETLAMVRSEILIFAEKRLKEMVATLNKSIETN